MFINERGTLVEKMRGIMEKFCIHKHLACFRDSEGVFSVDLLLHGVSVTDMIFGKLEAGSVGDRYVAGALGSFIMKVLEGKQSQYERYRFGYDPG
jgi:hypothetical protein